MANGGRLTIATRNVTFDADYVAARPYATPGEHAELTVADTGSGIDEDARQRIFEPFFTTKPQGQGTGLGLATVYGAVKQNHGSVEVESELGVGTTFRIFFPASREELHVSSTAATTSELPPGSETILLVEDDEIARRTALKILSRLGYRVLEAEHGAHALELETSFDGAIDLMVSDLVMPGLGGRELAEKMLARRPSLKVLFTSGYSAESVVRAGAALVDSPFIGKPFTPQNLAVTCRRVLDGDPVAGDRGGQPDRES
jgi:CheY-like chemotaxis protein